MFTSLRSLFLGLPGCFSLSCGDLVSLGVLLLLSVGSIQFLSSRDGVLGHSLFLEIGEFPMKLRTSSYVSYRSVGLFLSFSFLSSRRSSSPPLVFLPSLALNSLGRCPSFFFSTFYIHVHAQRAVSSLAPANTPRLRVGRPPRIFVGVFLHVCVYVRRSLLYVLVGDGGECGLRG